MLSSRAQCNIGGVRWWLGPGVGLADAAPFLREVLRQLAAGAENLKRGRRKELYRLQWPSQAGEWLLKVNRYDRGASRLQRARRSKARREFAIAIAIALKARGIDTPQPYAAGELRGAGGLRACYLLFPVLPGAFDLRESLRREDAPPAQRRRWIRDLGNLAHRLHAAGLDQRDFAPNNVLVLAGESPALLPIDFERARRRSRLGRRTRARMLAKLDRHLSGATASERWRFLLAYSAGDGRCARRLRPQVAREAARLAARDHSRFVRASRGPGRNVDLVEWAGWSGWARRDAPERSQAELATPGPPAATPSNAPGLQFEADAALWRGSGPASAREARRWWALAHVLWARRLGPRPVACLHRTGELRLRLARDPCSATLLERCDSAEAELASAVLLGRLRALGRVDRRLCPRNIALLRGPGTSARAELIDPSAFRAARPWGGRRNRDPLAERLQEIRKLREILRAPAG